VASPQAPVDGSAKDGVAGSGGFVTFPSASFTRDSKSLATYAAGKWLPVPRESVSSDETRYAYVVNSPDPFLHVVTIATGREVVIPLEPLITAATAARTRPGSGRAVLGFEPEGVYVQNVFLYSDSHPYGLALVEPASGNYVDPVGALSGNGEYIAVHGGYLYSGETADYTTAPRTAKEPYWHLIMMMQLKGADIMGLPIQVAEAWRSGGVVRLVGYAAPDVPFFAEETSTLYAVDMVYRVSDRSFSGQTVEVFTGHPGDPNNPTGPAVWDGNGTWFGSDSGVIWYYPDGGGAFMPVAIAPIHPVMIAGPCR